MGVLLACPSEQRWCRGRCNPPAVWLLAAPAPTAPFSTALMGHSPLSTAVQVQSQWLRLERGRKHNNRAQPITHTGGDLQGALKGFPTHEEQTP